MTAQGELQFEDVQTIWFAAEQNSTIRSMKAQEEEEEEGIIFCSRYPLVSDLKTVKGASKNKSVEQLEQEDEWAIMWVSMCVREEKIAWEARLGVGAKSSSSSSEATSTTRRAPFFIRCPSVCDSLQELKSLQDARTNERSDLEDARKNETQLSECKEERDPISRLQGRIRDPILGMHQGRMRFDLHVFVATDEDVSSLPVTPEASFISFPPNLKTG